MVLESPFTSIFVVILTLLFSITSDAQELHRSDTVDTRQRSEIEQLGIRVDGFLVYPRLGLEGLYDDNIFRTEQAEVDDFIWIVSPEVETRLNRNRHTLGFAASADLGRYTDNSDEDFNDWGLAVDGRYVASTGAWVLGRGQFAQRHEERGSPDAPGLAAEPTVYFVTDAFAQYVHRPSKITLRVDVDYTRFDFDDVARIGGGEIDQQFRDRNEYRLDVYPGYEFTPQFEGLLKVSGSRIDYDNSQELGSNVSATRSGWGYQIRTGIAFDFRGILLGELLLGYQERIFDDQIFPDISAPALSGSIDWNIKNLTTLNLTLEQSIEESSDLFFSGYLQTRGAVRLDHELLRNLIVRIRGSVEKQDYKGIEDAERDIYYYLAELGIQYLMNRHLYIKAGYKYVQREEQNNLVSSGVLDQDFRVNQVFIRLEGQL
jgi:hypothetical protein